MDRRTDWRLTVAIPRNVHRAVEQHKQEKISASIVPTWCAAVRPVAERLRLRQQSRSNSGSDLVCSRRLTRRARPQSNMYARYATILRFFDIRWHWPLTLWTENWHSIYLFPVERLYQFWYSMFFYRAMHVVLARYCYRNVVHPSVRLSVRDVDVRWAHRLD